jgi:isocitrate dehydrogenase kinase/phosphatase
MNKIKTDIQIAVQGAEGIHEAFCIYLALFEDITVRAKQRFKNRDWHGMRADAVKRLDLYKEAVDRIEAGMRRLLADRVQEKPLWIHIKTEYSRIIARNDAWEVAETFFNSVTRRIFDTVGVDPEIEFVNTDFDTPPIPIRSEVFATYQIRRSCASLIKRILSDYPLMAPYRDVEHDVAQVSARIESHLKDLGASGIVDRIEMTRHVFYRGMGAYLVGRIYAGSMRVPLAIALLNSADGLVVDGVLLSEKDISILFSFTRSHFFVDVERPYDLIKFLKTILPNKRTAELYISTGFSKHGKTELYRELLDYLSVCGEDRFDVSPGQPGMVMISFNMPSDDLVFKLIRDRFDRPKATSRREVMEKYELVFRHDRAGRLVDAQVFEHLKFETCNFSARLLAEMAREAGNTVKTENDNIIINHVYVERRVTPLDVFLQNTDQSQARDAVVDWGNAIKDLAVSNIFPGDILLKNFGVTRHGRVVFYDYDEICPLTSCNFRRLPPPTSDEDELASEPWFYVDENDVFPEEFSKFIGLPDPLKAVFLKHHADLFEVDFWHRAQEAIRSGEMPHIFPYTDNCRIGRR